MNITSGLNTENFSGSISQIPSGVHRIVLLELSNPWPLSGIEDILLKERPQADLQFVVTHPPEGLRKARVTCLPGGYPLSFLLKLLIYIKKNEVSLLILDRPSNWNLLKNWYARLGGAVVVMPDGQRYNREDYRSGSLLNALGILFLRIFFRLLVPFFSASPSAKESVEKILLVETGLMGDLILARPFIKALREKYPEAKLHVIALEGGEAIWHFLGDVDKVWVYSPIFANENGAYGGRNGGFFNALFSAFGLMRELRKERFDLGFELKGDARNLWLLAMSGPNKRIGMSIRSDMPFLLPETAARLLTNTTPYKWENRHNPHKWKQNLEILESFAGELKNATPPHCDVDGKEIYKKWPELSGRKFVAIQVGAGRIEKLWPEDRFARLINEEIVAVGAVPVLIGTKNDAGRAAEIKSAADDSVLDLTGKTTLQELSALLKESKLLVCHESGPMHLAGALGTPSVAIMSGSVSLFGPLESSSEAVMNNPPCKKLFIEHCDCPWESYACIDGIKYEDVSAAFQRVWEKAKGRM